MRYQGQLLQVGIVNFVFLLLLLGTYAYIEVSGISVDEMTFVVMQLTAFLNLAAIVCVAGAFYFIDTDPPRPWERD